MPIISNTANELQTSNNYTAREYNYNTTYVDNFIPYSESLVGSDVRISYDYIPPYCTTLSDSTDIRFSSGLFLPVNLKYSESLKEQICWNINIKYNKKSKRYYNKI